MSHLISSISNNIIQAIDLIDDQNKNRLFIDVRLGEPAEEIESFREIHILGAVYAQIRDIFASPPTLTIGNLPLPSIANLQIILDNWGVNKNTEIILYGPSLALAARGWWVLKWASVKNVKILDGGIKAWINNGGPVAQGDAAQVLIPPGEKIVLSAGHLPTIEVNEMAKLDTNKILIDARDEGSYLAGHIPRALNIPAANQWTPASTLRTINEMKKIYSELIVTSENETIVYCGGGVLSALTVLILSSIGINSRLFVGSWSEWNKDSERMARSASNGRLP